MGNIVFRMAHTYSLCVIFLNFHGFIFGMWSFSLSRVMTLILERNTHEIKRATIAATIFFCQLYMVEDDERCVYGMYIYIYTYIHTHTHTCIIFAFVHMNAILYRYKRFYSPWSWRSWSDPCVQCYRLRPGETYLGFPEDLDFVEEFNFTSLGNGDGQVLSLRFVFWEF